MTDTQNEVFKTPVNKIRLFEHGAPGSQNLKLTSGSMSRFSTS